MKETYMMEYIQYESEMIVEIIENKGCYITDLVELLVGGEIKKIYFSGHGSPYNVGEIMKLMIPHLLQIEVSNECPTLFNNHLDFNVNGVYKPEELLLICPAQSGKTKGPYEAAMHAKELGIKVACLTLFPEGPLAKVSDIVIDKKSGEEVSFAEIKGHVASLTILMLAIIEAAYKSHKIDKMEYDKYINGFYDISKNIANIVRVTEEWYQLNECDLIQQKYMTMIGYGANYVTANEGGLKILETTIIPCIGYELEEYMHGKNQLVNKDSVIFFIAPKEREQERMFSLFTWCKKISKNCILISKENNDFVDSKSITCNFTDIKFLSTIEYLVPFQVIAYLLANDLNRSTVIANHNNAGTELETRIEIY